MPDAGSTRILRGLGGNFVVEALFFSCGKLAVPFLVLGTMGWKPNRGIGRCRARPFWAKAPVWNRPVGVERRRPLSRIWLFALMLLAGAVSAVQPGVNARLASRIGLLESAFVSFAGGALCLGAIAGLFGRGSWKALAGAAPWEVSGGLMGAFYVTCVVLAVPRIGTAAAMAAAIAAQLGAGLFLDSLGAFGFEKLPLATTRVAGVLLLVAGALLVLKK